MKNNPELNEKKPEVAAAIEQICNRFDRSYNLSKVADQATLAEGMHEIGVHLATFAANATLSVHVGANGITSVTIHARPQE